MCLWGGGGGQMTSSVKLPSEFSYCYISYLNIYIKVFNEVHLSEYWLVCQ